MNEAKKKRRFRKDGVLEKVEQLLEDLPASVDELREAYLALVESYRRLHHRLHKTLVISDSYQSHLRDLNQRLELMAHTDLLTGLANRWEMVNRLEIEKSRCERHGTTFSLIMTDVDRFKEINDTFGHLAGDCVLREIALRLKSNSRTEDLCVRWGGDEFVILLPETNLRRAVAVADKLSHALQDVVISWERHGIRIGMSFGVGEFNSGSSIDDFINRVDNSLYRAKKAGKSGVAAEQGSSTVGRAPSDASGVP